jgi:ATP-dependent DNA helicase RecG
MFDVLLTLPKDIHHRVIMCDARTVSSGTDMIANVTVISVPKSSARPIQLIVQDECEQRLTLIFFKTLSKIAKSLKIGDKACIMGRLQKGPFGTQIIHPIFLQMDPSQIVGISPVYTSHVTQNLYIIKMVRSLLKKLPEISEWLSVDVLKAYQFPSFKDALEQVHHPNNHDDLNPLKSQAVSRLIFDEFLSYHASVLKSEVIDETIKGYSLTLKDHLRSKLMDNLPFSLTDDQIHVLKDIDHDLSQNKPMLRLLQGDVGSGKTIVALLTLLRAVENNSQGALLVPTDIVSRQHFKNLKLYCEPLGVRVALLTSQEKGKERQKILQDLKDGHVDIIIGTHALIQEHVEFEKLTIVVIDEQHRFGVKQRLLLTQKGHMMPHVLSMTATPIPRTLYLAHSSHMEMSHILHKPKGRGEITTTASSMEKIDQLKKSLTSQIQLGRQVYWVCAAIEESKNNVLTPAMERYDDLKKTMPNVRIALLHGQMKGVDKENVMRLFQEGAIDLLVSTTVIEVGVDVANASIMVIENADRFGLAQLHQLRGRVGRGEHDSFCILLYGQELSFIAKKRLKILCSTNNGFEIADMDLKLRGGGALLGTEQSGVPKFRLCQMIHEDKDLTIYLEDLFERAFLVCQTTSLSHLKILEKVFNTKDMPFYKRSG